MYKIQCVLDVRLKKSSLSLVGGAIIKGVCVCGIAHS